MDSSDKGLVAFGSFITMMIVSAIALFAYDAHLRAELVSNSNDPLSAACAYDSGGLSVPPSCFTLIAINKELIE